MIWILVAAGAAALYFLTQEDRPVLSDRPTPGPGYGGTATSTTPRDPQVRAIQLLINQINVKLEQVAADQLVTNVEPCAPNDILQAAVSQAPYPASREVIYPRIAEDGYIGPITRGMYRHFRELIETVGEVRCAELDNQMPWVEHLGIYPMVNIEDLNNTGKISVLTDFRDYLRWMTSYPRSMANVRARQWRAGWGTYLLLGRLVNTR